MEKKELDYMKVVAENKSLKKELEEKERRIIELEKAMLRMDQYVCPEVAKKNLEKFQRIMEQTNVYISVKSSNPAQSQLVQKESSEMKKVR